MFVDRVKIFVAGGKGGDGCVSFRREKFVPRGGPDGGDGGHGGSIIIEAKEGVDHLSAAAQIKHWKADNGTPGSSSNKNGRNGKDRIIRVPIGTLVIDANAGHTLKDLTNAGDRITVGRGGNGGYGNTHYKSASNRVPRQSTPGEKGESREIILELKMIADVGLVGLPNAGKSTLLSRMSGARPEIANYPFTTKRPNLGLVKTGFDQDFVLADIPGLIEGAHAGVGLGHEFLRHIERAGILVHLVEPEPMDGSDPIENYRSIRKELNQYSTELTMRPEVVVVSKIELPKGKEIQEKLTKRINRKVFGISAVTGEGLNLLSQAISHVLKQQRAMAKTDS
jgi:GTP-binding protein